MGTFFQFLYNLSGRFKWLFALLLLLTIGYAGFLASKLKFSEDITRVLPQSEKINNLNFVYSNAKFMDKVIFNIHPGDTLSTTNPILLVEFANRLSDSIAKKFMPEYVKSIDLPPGDEDILELYDVVYNHLPLFLDEEDYTVLDSMLSETEIEKAIEANYKTLISPMGMGTKKMIARDPLHFTPMVLTKFRTFQLSDNLGIFNGHLLSKDRRNLLLLITPASTNNTSANEILFDGIDELTAQLKTGKFSEIGIDYFGSPVVALGNAQRIKKDIILTVSVALTALILFISFFFKRKRSFFVIFLPVVFGGIVSIAALYLIQSEVSAIALGIGSVLLGISVDFSLHIFSHYRQHHNKKLIFKDLSTPVIMSAFTTAGAFLSLRFVNSQALNDLGLFAAISVLSAALFALLVLPHLLPSKKQNQEQVSSGIIDRIAAYNYSGNKILQYGILIVTILFLFLAHHVSFDADMMKNSYMSEELQQAESKLNEVTSLSKKTIYLVTPGATIDDALAKNEAITKMVRQLSEKGIAEEVTLLTDLFHSLDGQREAINRWETYWLSRKEETLGNIAKAGEKFSFKPVAFKQFSDWLNKDFQTVKISDLPLLNEQFFENLTIQTDTLSAVINILKVNSNGTDIQKAYTAIDEIPGTWLIDKRIITSEFMNILKDNFDRLIVISLLIVFVILLLAYGRIELTLVTMVPIFFSWIWVVGIMALLGISFNIFNVIILTFIFGLGIDYSIFIMRGMLQEYKYGCNDNASYKVSVIVSGITTLLGIGVLIFAKHPALKSIAIMSIIGILSVIFITFTLLPAIFSWMVSYKKGMRNRPVTFLDFLFSIASLIVFVGGALLMTFFSLLLRILPGNRKKKKYLFHVVFSKMTWFLIYMNFLSPKRIINPENEKYTPPAIVIANHQSHIDLMLMMLLNPKVLILTNRRNYTHPFYGKALQYADFLPSDIGYEKVAENLKELVQDGYSFVIYPEGHRNDDGTIKRFHKGAFYLAEKLNIDILPIIIHGQNQLLKKSEFFLKRGSITTKFLPRIDISKDKFGSDLREKTKGVNRYFRKEYAAVREEFETPGYWADYIVKNYTYKGPVLEWYTRVKLKLEDNYRFFNEIIPRKCTITDLGCGYGYLDFMLNLVSDQRRIKAVDYDEDKIAVARNCAIKSDRVDFISGDVTQMELEASDVFILNDVLHYFPKELQLKTLEKVISKVTPEGIIIIRDSDKELKKRHLGTKLTEFFSTNFGFNKTEHKLDFVSRKMIIDIAQKHRLNLEIIDNTKITSNLVYILRKA